MYMSRNAIIEAELKVMVQDVSDSEQPEVDGVPGKGKTIDSRKNNTELGGLENQGPQYRALKVVS